MVKRNLAIVGIVMAAVLATVEEAQAQLFGSRTLGQSLSRRARPGSTSVGSVSGRERFMRSNRQRSDFVGTDSRERRGFVGAVQAATTGSIRSTTSGRRRRSGSGRR